MKEGFLRSDTPQSEKLRVEVTSCFFLLLLDLFQTFLTFIQFMPRLGVQGEKGRKEQATLMRVVHFSLPLCLSWLLFLLS